MSMKISLFDADDLKAFEDLLFRAMVRTARVLRREGLIADYTQNAAAAPEPPKPTFLRDPHEAAAAAIHTAETVFRSQGSVALHDTVTPLPAPVREVERLTPEQWAARAKPPEKQKRRSAKDVCRTQAEKPQGCWITTDEAAKIMVNGSNLDIERAKTMLGQWILDREIAGVIVTSVKPPTKQLPGRLHVKREDVIARDKQRQENAAMLPGVVAMAARRAKERETAAA